MKASKFWNAQLPFWTVLSTSGALLAVPACATSRNAAKCTLNHQHEPACGMQLATGSVPMNGETEVTCALEQRANGDVSLRLSVITSCATTGPIDVAIAVLGSVRNERLERLLEPKRPTPLSTGHFPVPAVGTLIRTEVKATCVGADKRQIWGRARCVVPE